MSVVEEREAETLTRRSVDMARQESFGLDRRVLVARPGDKIRFCIRINGPPRHVVSVEVRGIPSSVAEVTVSPQMTRAPYTSEIALTIRRHAKPGLYSFTLVITNLTMSRSIGVEKLGLLILPRELSLSQYARLRRIYYREKLGAQGVLWYLIAKVYKNGASFMKLKRVYEFIRGGPVRKATVAKILKQMIRKDLIKKGKDGKYYPVVAKEEIAFSRINRSRVRIHHTTEKTAGKAKEELETRVGRHEPYEARLAFKRAWKMALKHNSLAAAYFLVYSLLGVRETGILLLWLNAMFVYCEQKTSFCHYFYSWLLHQYFQLLGLKQGIMYRDTIEYQKAIQTANKYIRKHYGSHQVARRLHYKLKEEKYIEYDDDVLNLEIIRYNDGDIGLRIWDNNMEEILYEENIVNKTITKTEIKPAYPFEHVYQHNEETYLYKPGGIY